MSGDRNANGRKTDPNSGGETPDRFNILPYCITLNQPYFTGTLVYTGCSAGSQLAAAGWWRGEWDREG